MTVAEGGSDYQDLLALTGGGNLDLLRKLAYFSHLAVNPCALVAQLVEQETLNLLVRGSNPCWRTIISLFKPGKPGFE